MADIFDLFKKISSEGSGAPQSAKVEWIIAGLGNPGADYRRTRHNAGFMCIGDIAARYGTTVDRARFSALTGRCEIGGHGVLLLCPQTYMNLSGEAVKEAADFYKIAPDHIIVICDDINFEPGKLRLKRKGSDGGHNGLKNIIYRLNSDAFPRIKLGVGQKPAGYDLADWVLSRFTDEEEAPLEEAIRKAVDGIPLILDGKIDEAMQKCN
ncbi:MAG: aminoacyl-tRNA hydrolase [Clostridia bacterium]|nr:aminoacyl-tRNA hydrolase [Clostridia bacterium]